VLEAQKRLAVTAAETTAATTTAAITTAVAREVESQMATMGAPMWREMQQLRNSVNDGEGAYARDLLRVWVKIPDETSVAIDIKLDDIVANLKAKIQEVKKIPFDEQRLQFWGKDMENSCTLTSCKVVQQSTIFLEREFQIFVDPLEGQQITINVSGTTTTDDFFIMVHDQMQNPGVPLHTDLRLTHNHTQLEEFIYYRS
jgi:hypothetical protein